MVEVRRQLGKRRTDVGAPSLQVQGDIEPSDIEMEHLGKQEDTSSDMDCCVQPSWTWKVCLGVGPMGKDLSPPQSSATFIHLI